MTTRLAFAFILSVTAGLGVISTAQAHVTTQCRPTHVGLHCCSYDDGRLLGCRDINDADPVRRG